MVRRAVDQLNDRQRMAVVLNKFEDMNYAEIAAVMGLTTKAVKSLLARTGTGCGSACCPTSSWTARSPPPPTPTRTGEPMPDTPAPTPEPADADLIAYLDGELDGDAARAVEARLARDPAARASAQAYKKTFDLLAALPSPEADPDFATRTLTRLEPVAESVLRPAARQRRLSSRVLLLCGFAAAFGIALIGRLSFGPLKGRDDDLQFSDLRVIEHLPLYLGTDDLEFARRLADARLFDPDGEGGLPVEPPPADREKLTARFRSYPPARQQQLRQLDQEFHELPEAECASVGRVLEKYAVWLDRLPDPARQAVLEVPTREERIEAIAGRLAHDRREAQPAAVRRRLDQTPGDERTAAADEWRAADKARREEWHLARRQWEKVARQGSKPWPFDQPELARQVDEFVRTALKADVVFRPGIPKQGELSPSCRLSFQEVIDLKVKHLGATENGNWFVYGLQVYRLAERHPYLPPPVGRPPVTEPKQVESKRPNLVESAKFRGKWPDFALSVADAFRRAKKPLPVPKGLGPARREEFSEPLRAFINQTLIPGLTADERAKLDGLEDRWPDYPQEVVRLAKKYDHPVLGVTLPGKPSEWGKYYSMARR